MQLEYFETILNPYFTHEARESLKSLQGVLLEKATESATESVETPSNRRRGGDEPSDERQQGSAVSPDDLIVRDPLLLLILFTLETKSLNKFYV